MSAKGPRRRVISPDEARIWRAIASSVTPLPGHELPDLEPEPEEFFSPEPPVNPPVAAVQLPKAAVPLRRELPGLAHGATPGLDKRSAERMKKGEMEIDARLDLHGMTQDSAHAQLLAFIGRAYDSGRRCVLVITGKGNREGTGVLRANTPRWLNQSPCRERILGFSFAKPQHGGEGALYVLIKRRR
ncbi:MAG: Smr/MutS family protein [Rhodospirillaceae bacterium]|nr:Smr/MutS family protein [Rhodospirillales bacterium]